MVDKNGLEVTPQRWEAVDLAIKSFIQAYPLVWLHFQNSLKANRTEYNLAQDGDLKKASWRHTMSFPVAWRPRTQAEIDEDPTHAPVEFGDSLKHWLDKVIPGFTDPDTGGGKGKTRMQDVKKNKLYYEFQKRYGHLFRPGDKL